MSRPPARFLVLSVLLFMSLVIAPAVLHPAAAGSDDAKDAATVSGFVAPQIILSTQKQPDYPPAALKARYTGSVLVEMTVSKEGEVEKVKVVECTRPKVGFEEATIEAVKQWRFKPGSQDGAPIEVVTRLKLNFDRISMGLEKKPEVTAGSFTAASSGSGGGASTGTSPK